MKAEHIVSSLEEGERLDILLRDRAPSYSRTSIKAFIESGLVLVNGGPASASLRVRQADLISYDLPDPAEDPPAEGHNLDILYEDEHLIAVNKPAGMTVHPVSLRHTGTLVNALLAYTDSLSDCAGPLRRGIVHRLDRDTSGIMIVARTNDIHESLSIQFRKREVGKIYTALVEGVLELDADRLSMKIERHSRRPQRMAASSKGRHADTDYEVVERFNRQTLVIAKPRTGRTHQIRLAFSEIGHPVVCDSLYGATKALMISERRILERQALHSTSISFVHPSSGRRMEFNAPLADDIENALVLLREMSGRMKNSNRRK